MEFFAPVTDTYIINSSYPIKIYQDGALLYDIPVCNNVQLDLISGYYYISNTATITRVGYNTNIEIGVIIRTDYSMKPKIVTRGVCECLFMILLPSLYSIGESSLCNMVSINNYAFVGEMSQTILNGSQVEFKVLNVPCEYIRLASNRMQIKFKVNSIKDILPNADYLYNYENNVYIKLYFSVNGEIFYHYLKFIPDYTDWQGDDFIVFEHDVLEINMTVGENLTKLKGVIEGIEYDSDYVIENITYKGLELV